MDKQKTIKKEIIIKPAACMVNFIETRIRYNSI